MQCDLRTINFFSTACNLQYFSSPFKPDLELVEKFVVAMMSYFQASWLELHMAFDAYHSFELVKDDEGDKVGGDEKEGEDEKDDELLATIHKIRKVCNEVHVVEVGYREVDRNHFLVKTRKSTVFRYDHELMNRIQYFGSEILGKFEVYALEWTDPVPEKSMKGVELQVTT